MLNFFGPANNLGMGVHCLNLMKAYEKLGHDVCLIPPLGEARIKNQNIDRWIANRLRFSPKDPSLMIFDLQYMTQFSGSPRIGMIVFETDKLTPLQQACVASCDLLVTPSRWGADILGQYGLTPTIIPEGFDPDIFPLIEKKQGRFSVIHAPGACHCAGMPSAMKDCRGLPSQSKLSSEPVFVHVGKFEWRKGTLQVIECFAEALKGREATLLMHVTNPFVQDYSLLGKTLDRLGFSSADGYNFRRLGLKIKFSEATDEPIAGLFAQADCGIFPSKGEGWGLPIQECIASGVPAIVGPWTAISDYLSPVYPAELLIKSPIRRLAEDGLWFHGDKGYWYEPQDDELMALILEAYNKVRILRTTEEWQVSVRFARSFTWASAAEKLEYFIQREIGK